MNIICFSDICWSFLWQRHQQLFTRFPSTWKILFFEPLSFRSIKEYPKCIFPRKIGNIILISLPRIPLFEKFYTFRKIEDVLVLIYIKIFSYIFNAKKPVLLFYEPRFSSLIGHFDEKFVLYEYIDNKLGFSEVPKFMRYYIELLTKKADIVTASSTGLYEDARKKGAKNVHLIKNAADINHFKNKDNRIPEDIKYLKKPILGYTGVLYDWFDYELIEKLAIRYPDYTLLLIGPVQPEQMKKVAMLKKYENINFTGKKSYNELPGYVNRFDVAIIPFRINNLTKYVNPVKIYEYFAAEKPVVSTALPDITEFKDVVYIANTHDEFLEFIKLSLENKKFDYSNILKNNSWDARSEKITNLIKNYSKVNTDLGKTI